MNAKRVLAIIGIILLLGMYACTMIFALMDSPAAKALFIGSLFCTFVVPVILYFSIRAMEINKSRGIGELIDDGENGGDSFDPDLSDELGSKEPSLFHTEKEETNHASDHSE